MTPDDIAASAERANMGIRPAMGHNAATRRAEERGAHLGDCPTPVVVGLDAPGPVTTLTGAERDAYLELRAATAAMTEWQAAGPVLRERMSAAIAALAKVG